MTQDNSSAQLVERLRELLKKATPRPWMAGTGGGGGATTYVYEDDGTGQQCRAVAACTLDFVTRNFDEREANAQLIAESISALPDLIEALTRVQPSTSSVEAVARAICGALYGPLEDGSWAVLSDAGRDSLRRCAEAAIAALPSPEREPMREALVRAYKQGALDVHEAWVEGLGEENAPSRDPDFAEAAYDYADAALAPPPAQSGDRT